MPICPANQQPAPRSAGPPSTPTYRKSADIIRGIETQYNDPKNRDVDREVLLTNLLCNAIDAKVKASNSFMGKHKSRSEVISAFKQVLSEYRQQSDFVSQAQKVLKNIELNPGVTPAGHIAPSSVPLNVFTVNQVAAMIKDRSLQFDLVTLDDLTQLSALITDSASQQNAAEALRNFSFNADSCKLLVEQRFHEKLGQLLITQKVSSIAKQYAAEAISNLSNDEANYNPLQNARDPLLEYFQASNPDSYGAQHARWAIINLTKKSVDETTLQGGVEWQFEQLSKLATSSTGREYAVKAAKLSSNPTNHSRLMDDNVHERLKESLKNAAVTPCAKEFAAMAISNLALNDAVSTKLIKAGVHTKLVGLLSGNATEKAKDYAAMAISNLALNDAVSTKLIKAGVHTQLVGLLSGNATEKAKDYAAKALLNLSSNTANRKTLVEAGVYTQLEALINNLNPESPARAQAEFAAMNFLNDMRPPVIQPQAPESSPLDEVFAVVTGGVGVVTGGVGVVSDALGTGLGTAQNKVAKVWNQFMNWLK